MTENSSSHFVPLSEELLSMLVAKLDDETVRAIILRGSYARGDALSPYSDIDLTRIIKETAGSTLPKRFFWSDGYLVSISTHSYAAYRERLTRPEQAIFVVTGIREARVLLDKDGAFSAFQQEALAFRWEPLQAAANAYAGQKMTELTEIILRTLRVLRYPNEVLLSKMLLDILIDTTEAVAIQQGLLLVGQDYYHHVQEAMGRDSSWTHYQRLAAGIGTNTSLPPSLSERGRAALRLYQETFRFLQASFSHEHREAIAPLVDLIANVLAHEKLS